MNEKGYVKGNDSNQVSHSSDYGNTFVYMNNCNYLIEYHNNVSVPLT